VAIEISLIVSVANLLGIGTIVSALIISWSKGKQEFARIKKCIMLELDQNLEIAKDIVSTVNTHTFPVPLLRDEAWHILISSEQLKRFGGERVEDPILELGYIYRRIALINQTVLSRQFLIFGTLRAMGKLYQKTLYGVDEVIKQNTEEIIRLMERTKSRLHQKNIIKAFRK
jgi:hypothetical protein